MVKAKGVFHSVHQRNKVDKVRDVCGKGRKANRNGNCYKGFKKFLFGSCLRRIVKFRLGDSVAFEVIMHHQIYHSHHSGNHNTGNCRSSGNRRQRGSFRKSFRRKSKVDSKEFSGFGGFGKTESCDKNGKRKTDYNFYNSFNNLRNRGGIHVAKSLIISAVSGSHAKEENRRRKDYYRKKSSRVSANGSRKKFASEKHNKASCGTGHKETGHGNLENSSDVAISSESYTFRNHSCNRNGNSRCCNGIKRRENSIGGVVIAETFAADYIHKRNFINCAYNFYNYCRNAEDQRALQKILFFGTQKLFPFRSEKVKTVTGKNSFRSPLKASKKF